MDGPARPAAISRTDSRYRYQYQNLAVNDLQHPREQLALARRDATLRGRERMTRAHRFFHRRAPQDGHKVVVVEVVNQVDELGNVIAQETRDPFLSDTLPTPVPLPLPDTNLPEVSPVPVIPNVPVPDVPSVPVPTLPDAPVPALPTVAVPTLPSVPAPELPAVPVPTLPSVPVPEVPNVPVPTLPNVPVPALTSVLPPVPSVPVPVLPSVPAVPPFPTNLEVPSVPPYPFPSLSPVEHVISSSAFASASLITPTPYVPVPAPVSIIDSATNTTSTPASLLSSSSALLASISASKPTDFAVSIQAVPTASTSDLLYLPSSEIASFTHTLITSHSSRSTSATPKPTTTTTATTGSSDGGAGGVGAGVPVPNSTATSEAGANSSPSTLETPKVIGSVLGSLAGVALLLALILLLLRRHKQRQGGALQLTGDERATNPPSMSQAPTTTSALVPIAFLNRFSGMSSRTAETNSSGGERSFQRVSGRKLPSAFSEGMTSDQFARGGTMSGTSFYQDDHGIYGGAAMSKEFGKEIGDTRDSGQMNIRPSPARTPVIRHPDDGNPFADHHHLSPPHSPVADLPPRGTLGRSLPSADGSRSSKFTENV